MKEGVRIINCARGGIINEEDLLEALNSGRILEEPPLTFSCKSLLWKHREPYESTQMSSFHLILGGVNS